ncbi:hypothetical protein FNU76_00140 [Chitinimonas arctica]|uniref:GAF domain-containing protein n=1 Tax=Chitinimonas arctica TaxID=2594795 RepID=A0A516S9R0_9NEIS|nr:hypothetical protein [Chitinimonas arctica]QDQ24876.1 hypothetical protein FNU76_00140 [Chitinimonas arctica]
MQQPDDPKRQLHRLQTIQQAILTVSRQASTCRDLADFGALVHAQLRSLMYADNFFIGVYEQETQALRFPYYSDQFDVGPAPERWVPLDSGETSRTAWVITHGQPLMLSAEEDRARQASGGRRDGAGPRNTGWACLCAMASMRSSAPW